MKKGLLLFAFALCGMPLFATDPTFTYSGVGVSDIIVDGGGSVISNQLVVIDPSCAVVPWKVEVSEAKKTATSSGTEFVPTNYVGVMTSTVTNWMAVASMNSVNGFELTNTVRTATVTNNFNSIVGLDLTEWAIVSTNGITRDVSIGTPTAAGGTLTVSNGDGTSWSALTLSSGAVAETNLFDGDKIAFGGTLRLTATQAERLRFRIKYLKLQK